MGPRPLIYKEKHYTCSSVHVVMKLSLNVIISLFVII
jgi:hypothetical protein